MKGVTALLLSLVMILTGCVSSNMQEHSQARADITADSASAADDTAEWEDDVPEFDSLDDDGLLQYAEDNIYAELTSQLKSDDYTIENITASYISQEYLDEVEFNSQSNVFFGYTIAELDDLFRGTRYVFTLGDDGKTTVEEMQVIEDKSAETILKNVAIGTGVILVCVTVSYFTVGTGTPAAVNLIFTAAAKTGTAFAMSSGLLGGASAGIIKGYQTGDMDEALEAAKLSGSEGFKWGAIAGSIAGGVSKAVSVFRSTRVMPTYRQSEIDVCNMTDNGIEQVSYLNGKKVSNTIRGTTRPDVVVQNANGTVNAIEVKNYNLESPGNRNNLLIELKRQVQARITHLPSGSTQEIVLDVRGRGYSTRFIDKVVDWLQSKLDSVYPDIPITVLRY